jgi:tetratricopeptide (TPR) repeat protein
MFFPKLRRKAKWVFAFIALAFGLSFVVAGVGSGFGSGIGDYLSELFNRQPGADTEASIENARERAEQNPRDADAQMDLANALMADGQTQQAIDALSAYVELDANNEEALQLLAGLYLIEANEADQGAERARSAGGVAFFSTELYGDELSQAFGSGPFVELQQQQASEAYSNAALAAQNFHSQEAEVWDKLVALRPEDLTYLLELGRSKQQANELEAAIVAYERYVEVAPEDDPTAEEVKTLVDQLKVAQAASNPEGGDGTNPGTGG